MAASPIKSTNAFMVLGRVQHLTVIDTANLVNQSFELPADQVPELSYDYDHLIVNCSEGPFTEEVLHDAAKKAINKVEVNHLESLSMEQSKSLFSGFKNALKDVEISGSSSLHAATVNRFLKSQLVNQNLERLVLRNCEANLNDLEDEIKRFLWHPGDSELMIFLDEPSEEEEECLSFDILNTFVEMTYMRQPKTGLQKKAEVYVNYPKNQVMNEIAKRDFSRELLNVKAETVSEGFCKLFLSYKTGR